MSPAMTSVAARGEPSRSPAPTGAQTLAPRGQDIPTVLELATLLGGVVVATCGAVSLLAAAAGWWSLPLVLGASGLLSALAGAVLGRSVGWRLASERWHVVAVLVALVAVMLVATAPGFRFGMTGWDPGVYQAHAQSIAETGDLDRANPVHANDVDDVTRAHYPGLVRSSDDPDRVDFGFFHLFPALGAVGYGIGRTFGVALVNPLLGALGLLSLFFLVRRLVAPPALAVVSTLLVAVSPVWLWHSQLPTSEMVAVTLLLCGAFGAAIGWRDRPAFLAAAGFLTGMASVARADGLLMLLTGAAVVAVLRYQRTDRSWLHFGAGLIPGLCLWWLQAYGTAADYARSHDVPAAWKAGAVILLPVLAAAVVFRPQVQPFARLRALIGERQLLLLRVGAVVYGLVLAGFAVRSVLAPEPNVAEPWTFAPKTIERLLVWLTPGGAVLAAAGVLALVGSRRYHALLIVLAPALVVLPLYLVHPRIHPRFIWWTRRFLPIIWVPLLVLVALGAVWLWDRRSRRWPRAAGLALRGLVVASLLAVSVPYLRLDRLILEVDELGGSFSFPDRVAAAIPANSIVVWQRGEAFSAFGVSTMVRGDLEVVPVDPGDLDEVLDDLVSQDRPVHVVGDADAPVTAEGVKPMQTISGTYEYLGFTYDRLPHRVELWSWAATVYEVSADDPG